jgi:hypothetical protein
VWEVKVMDIFLIIFYLIILKFPTFFRIEYRDSIMVFFNWFDSEMTSNQPSSIQLRELIDFELISQQNSQKLNSKLAGNQNLFQIQIFLSILFNILIFSLRYL